MVASSNFQLTLASSVVPPRDTVLAMYTAILTASLAIKHASARTCMRDVRAVRRAIADTCMNRMNLVCVMLPRGTRPCHVRSCVNAVVGRMALWRRAECHQRGLMWRSWACLVNVTVMVPTCGVFCKKPFPSKPGDALSSAN